MPQKPNSEKDKMENKTLEFVKNAMYSVGPFIAGGIAGAELSDLVTDSPAVISTVSTVGQYILGYPAFMAFHAKDNPNDFQTNRRWDYRKLAKGMGKILLSLAPAEIVYMTSRTLLANYLLKEGHDPIVASAGADAVALPLFFGVAIPLGKKFGLIKETNLEAKSEAK